MRLRHLRCDRKDFLSCYPVRIQVAEEGVAQCLVEPILHGLYAKEGSEFRAKPVKAAARVGLTELQLRAEGLSG